MEKSSQLLTSGIRAVKNGDKEAAVNLLIKVVEIDRQNEEAWLWLSRGLESTDHKRLCLKNVLTINPENEAAKEELEEIESVENGQTGFHAVERQIVPNSPAAAILYPDRLVRRWEEEDRPRVQTVPEISHTSSSKYSDVWEGDEELCAYCAAVIVEGQKRCPQCRKKLISMQLTEQKGSGSLIIFFLLVLAVGQLFLIQLFLDVIVGSQMTTLLWHGLILGFSFVFSVLIVIRHPSGYIGSILFLLIVITLLVGEWFTGAGVSAVVPTLSGEEYFIRMADNPFLTLTDPIIGFIRPFQIATILLALLYGIFRVGPDFEKQRFRSVARVDKGLFEASDYYLVGRRYEEQGLWASAILHYRRAAAKEPARPIFLNALGTAYAQLGFFERARDVLESALNLSRDTDFRSNIRAKIEGLETK